MGVRLLVEREGRLLRLTMNRPEKRNALNLSMCRDLLAALEAAEQDPAVGAVLLQGAGKAFCSGMDLDEVTSPETAGLASAHEALFTIGARITKPLVAAVQGAALGGGLGLAANAHIVAAAEDAAFGLTEIRLGMWPYVIYRAVSDAMGDRRTLELSLTGRVFGAGEALTYGLVHYVVPGSELDRRATEIALGLASSSEDALHSGLDFARKACSLDCKAGGELAAEFRARAFHSADFAEGVRAFRENRPPRWPSLEGSGEPR